MKKKILALVMAAAMTLGLTACGGGDSSSAGSAASTGSQSAGSASNVSASDFKVGAIYINKKSDTAGYTYAQGLHGLGDAGVVGIGLSLIHI